jgi:hypothetical protein
MATVIQFAAKSPETVSNPKVRTYSIDISAFPDDYLEFTANGVKVDAKSLYQIASELEKIASIIRSDVMSDVIKA